MRILTPTPALTLTLIVLASVAGCAATGPHAATTPERFAAGGPTRSDGRIVVRRIGAVADVPTAPVPTGGFRIYAFDVGTGLAILVQGADFALLYDGGTNDAAEDADRVLGFLFATLGPSGGDRCAPEGDHFEAADTTRTLATVVLSHPHQDHGSALARVLQCYLVRDVWDAGVVNDAAFYRAFIAAVAAEAGATYHTAAPPPADRAIVFDDGAVTLPGSVAWRGFGDGDVIALGAGARMTILNADGKPRSDKNANSIVVRLDLGATSVLLTGDAGSGPRADPEEAPGGLEADLIERHASAIDVDVLQVGHHGSKTSSRARFLAAVSPRYALVSTGPRKYGRVVLPDADVIAALGATGAAILRTDEHDGDCPVEDRIGLDDDGPGGCDSFLLEIAPPRPPTTEPPPLSSRP